MAAPRRVQPRERLSLRDVRPRALGDRSSAFASSLGTDVTRPPSPWAAVALVSSKSWGTVTFIAEDAGHCSVAGPCWPGGPQVVEVVSMWVDPEVRDGLGAYLAPQAFEWRGPGGAERVELPVTTASERATSPYRRLSFATTSHSRARLSGPCRDKARMFVLLLPSDA
jgi:hypothetical protein